MQALERHLAWRCALGDPPVELDLGFAGLEERDFDVLREPLERAIEAMERLEQGALANPDENRMVGHYWLRAPGLAPDETLGEEILANLCAIERFRDDVHAGAVEAPGGVRFDRVLLCGIGGSALGPMLLADCFGGEAGVPMAIDVLDNTDPAGIDRVLGRIGDLSTTLFLVVSKSGGTPETRNGMLEVARACAAQGVDFARQAVAVTGADSELERRADDEGWLRRFPMWDWVGGRTSIWSAVGLLPAALIGVDVRAFLAGAAAMDGATRARDPRRNPAALMALYWHVEGEGRGLRDAVVLPYKDALLLLPRYLQQLVMESLGKELDRQGRPVHQGLSVFGNKGSTDQHSYVQQLRDGIHNFFVTFVRVLDDRAGASAEVEPGITSGDYLDGFWLGTRAALAERGRHSATITLGQLDERSLGAVLALFERTVGIYAELIDVNAYHQPGVEAGKRAARQALDLQRRIVEALGPDERTVEELAAALGAEVDAEPVWQILRRLAVSRPGVRQIGGDSPTDARFLLG